MNASTILGSVSGLAMLGFILFGGETSMAKLWDPRGLVLVAGGTAAATMLAFPLGELRRIASVVVAVFRNERLYSHQDVEELGHVAKALSQGNVRDIEQSLPRIRNPFLRQAVELVLDATPVEDIIETLSWRIERLRAKERAEAQVFHAMASFAPAFGMIGTLLGLFEMFASMESGAAMTGQMATAFATTLYGVVLANLVFRPVAMKFEHRTEKRVETMSLIIHGIVLVCHRRPPDLIFHTMKTLGSELADRVTPLAMARKSGRAA